MKCRNAIFIFTTVDAIAVVALNSARICVAVFCGNVEISAALWAKTYGKQ
jgi:hypothetical protein